MKSAIASPKNRITLNIAAAVLALAALPVVSADDPASPESLLLKDYRPNSVYNTARTKVDKARYPAIDMHAHVYAKTPDRINDWIRTMDQANVARCVVLTMATGSEFDDICKLYAPYSDRFELWCGFDYTGYDKPGFGPAAVAELERCYKQGARGVGELGDKGKGMFYCRPAKAYGMHLDNPRMDPLLEKCAELQMPINIHVADPYWMYEPMDKTNDGLMNAYKWRLDNQPGIVGHAGMIDILERAVKRHPKTTFVACHLANCCYDLDRIGRLFDKYPNLYADISARYAEFAPTPRTTAKFFEKYQDRIVYGTDMSFSRSTYAITFRILESADEHFYDWNHFSYHWPLHGLDLDDKVLEKIYHKNALSILQQRPGKSDN